MIKLLANQQAASIIELQVAVAIFAIAAIGLSPSLLSTRKVADLGKDQSTAATLGLDKIEQLRTQAGVVSGNDTSGIFARSWTVTANQPVGTGLNRLEMVVSWTERESTNSVRLVTLLLP